IIIIERLNANACVIYGSCPPRYSAIRKTASKNICKNVISDLESVLGPVPERQMQSYTSIQEVYGAPRMQLASLPRDMLKKLVEGLGCDFYEVLQPLRDIRPLNGGPGYSDDMVMYVRGLNFELE
ncbi:hypothetical protein Vretimale_19829, partial [Volvox reticuliferus]